MAPYHHGNLRDELVSAAVELARTGGPDAVVLRETSRRAGVSHNAAYRHFADKDDLLREVCARCMRRLALLVERRVGEVRSADDPAADGWARLEACGRAYVEFAVTEPGWFRTAFSVPRALHALRPDEGVGDSGLGPYQLLGRQLDELTAAGQIPAARRPGLESAAWAAVHGTASLFVDGPLKVLSADEREHVLATVLDVVCAGLPGPAGGTGGRVSGTPARRPQPA